MAAGLRDRAAARPPTTAPAGTAATCRRPRASAASAIRASTPSSRASTRCAAGPPAATGVHVGVAAHSVRAVPASWLEAIAAYAERHGLVRHVHAHEQPRELEECRAEHGLSPSSCSTARGFLGPRTSVVHGIHVDAGDVRAAGRERHDRRLLPDDRGQPRRRPLPRADLPRRGRADRDRQRLAGARRPVRGGARARDARPPRAAHAPRAAGGLRRPVGRAGAQRAREPRASTTPARSRSTATIRTCAGSRTRTWRSRSRPARRRRVDACRSHCAAVSARFRRCFRPHRSLRRSLPYRAAA